MLIIYKKTKISEDRKGQHYFALYIRCKYVSNKFKLK